MKQGTREDYKKRILRVLMHIQKNLDEPLPLEELAGVACLSPYHFHRVFAGMVGEGVREHIRRLRLERAAYRLSVSGHPVVRIALEAGYETHESFTRAFKEMFGLSPSAYRRFRSASRRNEAASLVHYEPAGGLEDFVRKDTGGAYMEVTIKKLPPRRVAFVRHVGPYIECGKAWDKLCGWASSKGLFGPDTICLGISYDDPDITPPEKLRYDACLTVGEDVQAEDEIGLQDIAGGDYAVTVHRGPFNLLNKTYHRVCGEWIPASGRELSSAPCLEICLNDPEVTPEEELMVEVCLPLVSLD